MNTSPRSEVGRELRVSDLRERMIVILSRPDSDVAVTVWVKSLGEGMVAFYAGVTRALFVAAVSADGTITDNTGRQVMMFEYLGEP